MTLLIDIKRIKHAKAKTLVGQAFFRWAELAVLQTARDILAF